MINQKRGFTLIELLIVIAIVMVISTFSVNGYVNYRKNAVLDLTVDNFLSQIAQLRSDTVYGETNGERLDDLLEVEGGLVERPEVNAVCQGVSFVREGENFVPYAYSVDFAGQKVWTVDGWRYAGCMQPEEEDLRPLDLDAGIVVKGVDQEFDFWFKPPNGELELSLPIEEIDLILTYASGSSERYQRTISLNFEDEVFRRK